MNGDKTSESLGSIYKIFSCFVFVFAVLIFCLIPLNAITSVPVAIAKVSENGAYGLGYSLAMLTIYYLLFALSSYLFKGAKNWFKGVQWNGHV